MRKKRPKLTKMDLSKVTLRILDPVQAAKANGGSCNPCGEVCTYPHCAF
jgi:hypothetical protein